MALTIVRHGFPFPPGAFGGRRMGYVDITFDSSYPTGGEPLVAADLGLGTIELLIPAQRNTAAALHTVNYDSQAHTLVALVAGIQVANAVNLATLTVRCFYIGA